MEQQLDFHSVKLLLAKQKTDKPKDTKQRHVVVYIDHEGCAFWIYLPKGDLNTGYEYDPTAMLIAVRTQSRIRS